MSKFASTNLFKPITVGDVTLENRVVHTPTTRMRASEEGLPTDIMADYYGARAENNGGLLIVEATNASEKFGLYKHTPTFHNHEVAQHWKPFVKRIHDNGSKVSVQLWALGRVADPFYSKERGSPMVSASAIYPDEDSKKNAIAAGNELRAMTIEEIQALKKDFVEAAKNAVEVGMDFVEVHAAHGYMFDQFLRDVSNHRTDQYGGSIENRSRFLLETIDAMIEAVGASKIGVRLSPYASFQGSGGINNEVHPIAQFGYIFSELEKRAKAGNRLAYISFVEPVLNGIVMNDVVVDPNPHWMEEIWQGVILRAGNYLKEEDKLIENVNLNDRTLIGVTRQYTSNPDLVERLKKGLELTPYVRSTFYDVFNNNGYNTYPKYGEAAISADSEIAKHVPKAL